MFAHVENDLIEIHSTLPQNWRNVSNLPAADAEHLRALGWYTVTEGEKPSFDPATQIMEYSDSYTPGTGVTRTYSVRSATQAEIDAHTAAVAAEALRQKALYNAPFLDELKTLDLSIPRGLEDAWSASGFNTATLPTATKAKLARKATLRASLQ